ncbi:prealbumin-like fold domain-containing protein [Agromyces binzhouensis]|uniref:prealbumin-like fold domain-containing protein n=1 Tax=Agromyces binzhouensis TaxID=1817495 RepID=UPI00363BCB4A
MPHTTRIRTPEERITFRRRCLRAAAVTGILALGATAFIGGPALAAHGDVSLIGSDFEIDTDANLKVDHATPPSLDWANVNEARQADVESGTGDDSFGQGSKEDTEVPSVVSGSIPPNKSDLKNFGTYLEETPGGDFLHMFWHRVQDPTGTTNMDFEFNQSETLSANGVTPVRTDGDLLIQYDLANGGTNPELFLSRWVASGPKSQCEAANSTPCWGTRVNLSAAGDATGSINTSMIPAADAEGLGDISARTFGEASVDFSAIVGDGCVTFGSAYLKSRSSDSFTAAMKDFIAPLDTGIDSCAQVIIRKVTDPSPDPSDSSFSYTTGNFETPTETNPSFSLKNGESQDYSQVFIGSGLTVTEDLAALPAGWKLDSIDCSASSGVTPLTDVATGTITFDLDANSDVVDCTYYNETGGTVIVRKVTDPDPDPSNASFGYSTVLDTLTNGTDPSFSLGNGDSQTYDDVLLGTGYTITEDLLPAGWAFEDLDCSASSGVSPNIVGATVTFDIDDASDVLDCTYGNQTGGTVIVRKVTQPSPDASDTSFDYSTAFSTLSGATDPTFSLKDGEQQTYSDVLFGTGLTVAEGALPPGWELIDVDCSQSSGVTPVIVDELVTFTIDDAEDVLDCTYTNRASGSIVVEKITDSGSGSFEFTSTTLSPSPFTLTTTAAGAGGKDSQTFSNLDPGTYDVAETIPDYWNLVSATCDDGSDPSAIGLSPGETVTCTFNDDRELGSIRIEKDRKHAADGLGVNHPHEGVDFTITGGELPPEGVLVTTDANGVACYTGLVVSGLVGNYTVEESIPDGYVMAVPGTQTANVAEASADDCSDANAGAVKQFTNIPLTNITVSVDSQVPGGTFSSIECDVAGSDSVSIADAIDDPSITINDLEPRTVVCTIVIDP